MPPASKKLSFGQELVEAMKIVLAHHGGEIEIEREAPRRRSAQAIPKQSNTPAQ